MISGASRAASVLACTGLLVIAQTVAAQQVAPRLQVEQRVDAITGDPWATHAGLGVTAPLGTYVRFGAVAGLGTAAGELSSRLDLVARFTLDPFREKKWAPYGVGGVSARFGNGAGNFLLLMAGIEGPTAFRGFAPAIEFGFGGSFRVGVIFRQAFPRRR